MPFYCKIIYYAFLQQNDLQFVFKQNNSKLDEFIMEVDVERFGCNNLLQDFKFMKCC